MPVFSSCMHAVANTPVGPSGASLYVSRKRRPSLFLARSAPTSPVSWPARRSLTLRPAYSLTPNRGLFLGCFSPSRYLLEPLRVLPAGATVAGRDSHPLEKTRLFTAHEKSRLGHPPLRPVCFTYRDEMAGQDRRGAVGSRGVEEATATDGWKLHTRECRRFLGPYSCCQSQTRAILC